MRGTLDRATFRTLGTMGSCSSMSSPSFVGRTEP
jgi:hypothetical protein